MVQTWINTFVGKRACGLSAACRLACALTILCTLGVYMAGCNTVKGFGRDVEAVAQGGQDIIDGKH